MLTFIAWAFSVDIWDSEVVQFNPLETEYSANEKSLRFVFICTCTKEKTNNNSIKNYYGEKLPISKTLIAL